MASHKLQTRETMRAEMTPNVYAGPACDGVEPRWHGYCEGDKESETFSEPITLDAKQYPPGTIVTVAVPCCPQCGVPWQESITMPTLATRRAAATKGVYTFADKCECGFDWKAWTLETYS